LLGFERGGRRRHRASDAKQGHIDLRLTIIANQFHGVLLHYWKFRAETLGGEAFYSRGDLRRMQEWVMTTQDDLMPVGLFVSFEAGWQAIKEYIETDGALPKSIPWLADRELPVDAFPRFELNEAQLSSSRDE
jgi:hypothetical protein